AHRPGYYRRHGRLRAIRDSRIRPRDPERTAQSRGTVPSSRRSRPASTALPDRRNRVAAPGFRRPFGTGSGLTTSIPAETMASRRVEPPRRSLTRSGVPGVQATLERGVLSHAILDPPRLATYGLPGCRLPDRGTSGAVRWTGTLRRPRRHEDRSSRGRAGRF